MKKLDTNVFLNELSNLRGFKSRYRAVKEEPMPNGFFSSADLAKKYNTVQRVTQRWISESIQRNELEIRFVRRSTNGVFVRKIPVYKFKTKANAKSFKSRHQGK